MNSLLLVIVLACTLYNFDNSVLRLIVLSLWMVIPIFILCLVKDYKINLDSSKLIKNELFFLFSSYCFLILCWLYSSDTLSIGVSGATGEMITPFLYVFHVLSIVVFLLALNKKIIAKYFIDKFYMVLIFILCIDMVARYIEAPSLFMNYNDRFNAKNTGFFVNTNVLGQSIAFMIIISELVKLKNKRIIQLMLLAILVTTMARSAIIALLCVYIFSVLWKQKVIYKILAIILGFVNLVGVSIIFQNLNLSADGSFLSKIEFVNNTLLLINDGSIWDIIFGFGASFDVIVSKLNVGEYSPHLSILKAFLYYGLIGVLFFICMLYRMYLIHPNMLFPIVSFLIFGLAGAPIYWPTLTAGLVLLLINDSVEKSQC